MRNLLIHYYNTLRRDAFADKTTLVFGIALALKFLVFDVLWSIPTTFKPFSIFEFYPAKIVAILLLLFPVKVFRSRVAQTVVLFLLDGLLVANLMYFRTYYTAIPLASYGQAGNLADFMSSVVDSLRWVDLVFPLTTLLCIPFALKIKQKERRLSLYLTTLAIGAVALAVPTIAKGGYYKAYNDGRQQAYLCSSMPSVYTVFGSMLFDWIDSGKQLTDEMRAEVNAWLDARPKSPRYEGAKRKNCVVILCESLESWVLQDTVEGQEIMPNLNRLLADTTTLYAPNVLTQVRGGRSIDAQLILFAGMLPLASGTYSSQYAGNEYFTIPKAMKAAYSSRGYLLTIDKLSTWNQGPVAQAFGVDTLIAYSDFRLDEAFGTHKRTGDRAFMRQCAEKIRAGEVWKNGENAFLQLVTYSGHAPFVIPDELRELHFSDAVPEKMADYMHAAHYTDSAIGEFVDFLKTLPQYDETLIVITGDHEGLADYRSAIRATDMGKKHVSAGLFTPLIVLNSPCGAMRYDGVMGQIDVYPTLLDLLGVVDYPWRGMGGSILNQAKAPFAVSPQLEAVGEGYDSASLDHARRAYDVSDIMLRFDFFKSED